jgi:hypothetical protein
MKIVDEPEQFFNEQFKMRYAANRVEGMALNQLQPYINRKTGYLKLESQEQLLDWLQLAFRDQDIWTTANWELLKLKQKDLEFAQYYAEFQWWVLDVAWTEAAQLEVLRQGISEDLKDSLQHCDITLDLMEFVNMCSKRDTQIHTRAAERKSKSWTAGSKKHETTSNTTPARETVPAGTVAGYHSPAPMDLSAVKGRKITPEERKTRSGGGLCRYCGDSRHFAASCPRKLKAVSKQVKITPFRESGKGKEVEQEVESGKV